MVPKKILPVCVIVIAVIALLLIVFLPSPAPATKPGSVDPSFNSPDGFVLFNSGAGNRDRGVEVAVQNDGKIVVLGYTNNAKNEDVLLARYNSDGSPDKSFGNGGFVLYNGGGNDRGLGLALQEDGKILTTGYTYAGTQRDVLLLRYNANGKPDASFGTGGIVTYSSPGSATDIGFGVAVQPDGGIIVAGETANSTNQNALVLRYTSAGSPDERFGTGGIFTYGGAGMDRGFATAVQPDGKIIVAGSTVVNSKDDVLVFRLDPKGTPDKTFGADGAVPYSGAGDNSDYGNCITLAKDNRILVSGATSNGGAFDILLLQYNPDGTPDTMFGTNGVAVYGDAAERNEYGYSHAVQRDGKIVVTGFIRWFTGDDVLVVRFNPAGQPDPAFGTGGLVTWNGPGGKTDYGQGLALQTDGKIVVTGFSNNGMDEDLLLVRFLQ